MGAREGGMGKINWGRVFLCGLLTGVVWGVLATIAVTLVGGDFLAAVPAGQPFPPTSAGLLAFFIITNLVLGISTMWLYAAIRPRYGPGAKTAAVAGFALWFIGSWADAVWAALGVVPPGVLVAPVAASLPAIIVAAVVGAWLYKE